MKPINNHSEGCDPISSNCVIWQGPDLKCISLCKGDTVSTVVYKLATELCDLMDQFEIESYDLECLNLGACTPKDFKELIQILIDRICTLSGVDSGNISIETPNLSVIPINPNFYYENEKGDLVKTMRVDDYVITVANSFVKTSSEVETQKKAVDGIKTIVDQLSKESSKSIELPTVQPAYILDDETSLEEFLLALEEEFVNYKKYVGDEEALLFAIQSQTPGLNQADQLHGAGKMADIAGWIGSPANLANTVSNLWRTVTDVRNALNYIMINGLNNSSGDIDLKVTGTVLASDQIRLDFSGTVPNNFIDSEMGTTLEFYDSTGAGPQIINNVRLKQDYLDTASSYFATLTVVNGNNNITVKVKYRFVDSIKESTVSDCITTTALGLTSCPGVSYIAAEESISYSFQWLGTNAQNLTMQLWDKYENQLLQSSPVVVLNDVGSGTFLGLTQQTDYVLKLVVNGNSCESQTVTTLFYPCVAPVMSSVAPTYNDLRGYTTCQNIVSWINGL